MSEHDEHTSFIKTPQQLAVIVLLAFIVPIMAIVLVVQLVVNRPGADASAMTPQAVAARIQPVGRVAFSEEPGAPGSPTAAAGSGAKPAAADGKKVYDTTCMACHATGAANAPKLGDKAAWAPRIKSGAGSLVKSVLNGKGAMPPKGGSAALSEAEIRAAVEYLVSQSK
jgi:cytochrome c5